MSRHAHVVIFRFAVGFRFGIGFCFLLLVFLLTAALVLAITTAVLVPGAGVEH